MCCDDGDGSMFLYVKYFDFKSLMAAAAVDALLLLAMTTNDTQKTNCDGFSFKFDFCKMAFSHGVQR